MRQLRLHCRASGHTLMELVVAMVASAVLLAGLGSVMLIGRQVAYMPTAAEHGTEAAAVVNQIAEELRYATLIIQQTPQILEFVVADRNGDGTAEKIRYEWSGTPGDPLYRKLNATTAVPVLEAVRTFTAELDFKAKATALKTTSESAEQVLVANTFVQSGNDQDITSTSYTANQLLPTVFAGVPANALYWSATKVDFYSSKSGPSNETLLVQIRATGDPSDSPTSNVLGQAAISENTLSGSMSWNTAVFPNPIRNLALHRRYALVFAGVGGAPAAKIRVNDSFPTGVLETTDAGASWQLNTVRQLYGRIYGTYTTPGPTYGLTRNYVSRVRLALQTAEQSHSRIDAAIPTGNLPELLSAYWRADFERNPITSDANGDSVSDWALAGGSFDINTLTNGVWEADGSLETRPPCDFTTPTTVEVRCRNATIGGNGAVVRINADRQAGVYAPLLVYVQRQADGTQTLSLLGKTSDGATKLLFSRTRLSGEFIRYRLTILPQYDVVNLTINDEDQGSFTYPTYAPSSTSDRFLNLDYDTSIAEFDYVDVRVATN